MDIKHFEVLFTHQKQKKNKTWQDGILKVVSNGTKAVLCDDESNSLEIFHVNSKKVFTGSDIECERYLISIGDEKKSLTTQTGPCTSVPDNKKDLSIAPGAWNSGVRKRKREFYVNCKPDLPSPHHLRQPELNTQTTRRREKTIPNDLTFESGANNYELHNFEVTSNVPQCYASETGAHLKSRFPTLNQPNQIVHNTQRPPFKRNREELLSLFSNKLPTSVNSRSKREIEPPQRRSFEQEETRFYNNQEHQKKLIAGNWTGNQSHEGATDRELYVEDAFKADGSQRLDSFLNISDEFEDMESDASFFEEFHKTSAQPQMSYSLVLGKPEADGNYGLQERSSWSVNFEPSSVNDVIIPEDLNVRGSTDNQETPSSVRQNPSIVTSTSSSCASRPVNTSTSSVNDNHVLVRSNSELCPRMQLPSDLVFPSSEECSVNVTPSREVTIPVKFQSTSQYKQILKSALKEHLNIILFELAQRYFGVLTKVDIGSLSDSSEQKENVKGPSCTHGQAKLRAVKKNGPNKGRHFYSCPGSGSNQCKFFKWADECNSELSTGNKKLSLTSPDSIRVYFKSKNIHIYHECAFERRAAMNFSKKMSGNKYSRGRYNINNEKRSMFIALKHKEHSSLYSKDDIWIISKTLNFEPNLTFIARSVFYGPSSSGDLEIEPMSGYSTSNWKSGDTVHAIWACNAGTELSCVKNLEEHVTLQSMPILPYLMNGAELPSCSYRAHSSSFTTPMLRNYNRNSLGISWQVIEEQTEMMVIQYKLNQGPNYQNVDVNGKPKTAIFSSKFGMFVHQKLMNTLAFQDQVSAIRSCARMFLCEEGAELPPVTLIHGVFGAGKSFLLAVVVLLLVKLFEIAAASEETCTSSVNWKILISSTTNVAVDRILLGILDLGFDQFVRVGSIRKIAKPILPFSIHSIGSESHELKELQGMLKSDLTFAEKSYVRKSIEKHKLGENRKRLASVRVVGVTCAACTFPALEKLKFPVVLLDECSQMTEPSSLLPIARFGCRKLVLVGDPKQLSPTIQGSEPGHEAGLEQTLFDRFMKMEMQPILLRTQTKPEELVIKTGSTLKAYRCHPRISSVANRLFYDGLLLDGVTDDERQPVVTFLPTLCFYNVSKGKEECSQDGSYFNKCEANFVVFLIKSLLESDVDPKQIGVITQYKSQLATITNSLMSDQSSPNKEIKAIQISTVDAFQGGEKDVIILSCVRTQHVGFIDCKRRTNVALTRAKRHLCIVGCGKMLSSNTLWGQIINISRECDNGVQSSDQFIRHWNEIKPTLLKENTKKSKSCTTTKTCSKQKTNVDSERDVILVEEDMDIPLSSFDKTQSSSCNKNYCDQVEIDAACDEVEIDAGACDVALVNNDMIDVTIVNSDVANGINDDEKDGDAFSDVLSYFETISDDDLPEIFI